MARTQLLATERKTSARNLQKRVHVVQHTLGSDRKDRADSQIRKLATSGKLNELLLNASLSPVLVHEQNRLRGALLARASVGILKKHS